MVKAESKEMILSICSTRHNMIVDTDIESLHSAALIYFNLCNCQIECGYGD